MVPNIELKVKILREFPTQKEFGDALGVPELIVSQVVNERKNLTQAEKMRWAKKLCCAVKDIF